MFKFDNIKIITKNYFTINNNLFRDVMGKNKKKKRKDETLFYNSKEKISLEGFKTIKVIKAGRRGKNLNLVDLNGD